MATAHQWRARASPLGNAIMPDGTTVGPGSAFAPAMSDCGHRAGIDEDLRAPPVWRWRFFGGIVICRHVEPVGRSRCTCCRAIKGGLGLRVVWRKP